MSQRMFTLQLISALIGGRVYTHMRGRRTSNVPDCPAETRWNKDLVYAPEMLSNQSKYIVHTHRTYTRYICRVCKVRMCPDPCFFRYHSMTDYEYHDPKKAGVPIAMKKRKLS